MREVLYNGYDISVHNSEIDWNALKCDFVILRAGYGKTVNQKDKLFEQHYENAKKRGKFVGAYWYSYAMTEAEAIQEAKACIEVIKNKKFEFPIYFDLEEDKQFKTGKTNVSKIIRAFLNEVEKAGYFVGLYTNYNALCHYIDDDIKTRYNIWLAHWDISYPIYGGQFSVWQSGVGKNIAGAGGAIDVDKCYDDLPKIIKEKGLNGYSSDTEPDTITVAIKVNNKTYTGELTAHN